MTKIKLAIVGIISLSSFFLIATMIMPGNASYSQLLTVKCKTLDELNVFMAPENYIEWSARYRRYSDDLEVQGQGDDLFNIVDKSNNEVIASFYYVLTDTNSIKLTEMIGKNSVEHLIIIEPGSSGQNVKLHAHFPISFFKRVFPGIFYHEMLKQHVEDSLENLNNCCKS